MTAAPLFRWRHRDGQPARQAELISQIRQQARAGVTHHTTTVSRDFQASTTPITIHH
jgi:hypothetical protein